MTHTPRKNTLTALAASFLAAALLSACGPDNRSARNGMNEDQTDPLDQYTEKQKTTLAKLTMESEANRNLIEGKQASIDLLYFNQKVKATAGDAPAKMPTSVFSYACLSHNPDITAQMTKHRVEEEAACLSAYTGENSQTLGQDIKEKLTRFVAAYDGKTPVAPLFHSRSTPIVVEPDTVTAYLPELDMKCTLLHYTDTYKIDGSGNHYTSSTPTSSYGLPYAHTPYVYVALRDCEPVTEASNPLAAKRLKHLKAQIG